MPRPARRRSRPRTGTGRPGPGQSAARRSFPRGQRLRAEQQEERGQALLVGHQRVVGPQRVQREQRPAAQRGRGERPGGRHRARQRDRRPGRPRPRTRGAPTADRGSRRGPGRRAPGAGAASSRSAAGRIARGAGTESPPKTAGSDEDEGHAHSEGERDRSAARPRRRSAQRTFTSRPRTASPLPPPPSPQLLLALRLAVGQVTVYCRAATKRCAFAAVFGEHVLGGLQVPGHAAEAGRARPGEVRHRAPPRGRDARSSPGRPWRPCTQYVMSAPSGGFAPRKTAPPFQSANPGSRWRGQRRARREQVGLPAPRTSAVSSCSGRMSSITYRLRPWVRDHQVAVARVDQDVVHRHRGQAAQRRPVRAAVQAGEQPELRAREEQLRRRAGSSRTTFTGPSAGRSPAIDCQVRPPSAVR